MEPVLIDWIWKILTGVAVFLLYAYRDHEKRIQKMEDVQGLKIDAQSVKIDAQDKKIDALVVKITQMEKELTTIKAEVHINKDLVNQMKGTIYNVNKWIESQQKDERK